MATTPPNAIERGYVLAAGEGTRMSGGRGCSKPMRLVWGRHLIQYGLDAMSSAGISEIHVIYSSRSEDLLSLQDAYPHVAFHLQEDVDGSLSSLLFVSRMAHPPFLLMDADVIVSPLHFACMLSGVMADDNHEMCMAVAENNMFGAERSVVLGPGGSIKEYAKPVHGTMPREDARPGGMVYVWKDSPLNGVLDATGRTNSMSIYLREEVKKRCVGAMRIYDIWDVDTPEDIVRTEALLDSGYLGLSRIA